MNSIKPKVAFIALSCALLFLSNPALSQPVNQTYTTAGNFTYTIPSGWTATIKVEVWGAGGGGGGNTALAGGGGGGGGYASTTYTNLTADNYNVHVGAGGKGAKPSGATYSSATGGDASSFTHGSISAIKAEGGGPGGTFAYGLPPTPGAGGLGGSANVGTILHNGGNGGLTTTNNTATNSGGGGGGSATAMANGGNGGDGSGIPGSPIGGTGGTGEGAGGKGGDAGASPSHGVNGISPGGGGGSKPSNLYIPPTPPFVPTLSGDGADGQVKITVESSTVLPANFGNFSAIREGNQFSISFTTLQETNNDHFNLQSSQNGVDFTTIATIQSKHADGNASGSTAYHLTLDIAGKISFAVSLFALLGIGVLGFNRKSRILLAALMLLGAGGFIVSCTKNTNELATGETGKAFLRIEQVDKNGHSTYSKVITITNE